MKHSDLEAGGLWDFSKLRAATISFVLLMLLCTPISGTISATEPPDGGQSITITGDVTWDQDDDFDGIVDIANGASLTISADLDVANESRITVHPGGNFLFPMVH